MVMFDKKRELLDDAAYIMEETLRLLAETTAGEESLVYIEINRWVTEYDQFIHNEELNFERD